ncbi:MAG: GAF domain-containing sensor histidine kinase, partial [Anaerolineales bacterium]|nr:GAF domain-containing protein [Anaerolineales bacterium]MDW8447294.1 GAF domain-containing sensor histidine kinase [Anaerolineales bacterium]
MGLPKPGGETIDHPYLTVTQTEISHNLVEAELVASVSWLIKLRWIAGAGVLLATWIVRSLFQVGAPFAILSGIGIAILVYNTIFFLYERRAKQRGATTKEFRSLAIWQTALDWIAMTLLFHYSGGVESPAIWYFIFHIIIAAIFFSRGVAFLLSLLSILLVGGTVLFEYLGWLPHRPLQNYLPVSLYRSPIYILGVLSFFSTTAIFVAFLVGSIQERLRRREAEVIQLSENLQRATLRLQAINEIFKVISSTLDLKQVLERLVGTTAQAMGARACSIHMLDKSGLYLEPVATYGPSDVNIHKGAIDALTHPLAKEALSGKVVNIPSAPQSSLFQSPLESSREGIQSILCAPLIGKGRPIGILLAYHEEPSYFNKEDEEFISAIAAQGSIAIENAMAYQAMSELDQMKSQFIHTATHELRSPVSVTRSLLRTITAGYAGEITAQQKEILERATRRIEFLQKLIDDLLDLAAGKVGGFMAQGTQPVSVKEAIEKVVDRFKIPAQEKSIELRFEWNCLSNGLYVKATVEALDRIFNNLIS